MSVPAGQTTTRTSYRTVSVSSEPRTQVISPGPASPLSPLSGSFSLNGSPQYETVRYLVPVQQGLQQQGQQGFFLMPQPQMMSQVQMMPQMLSPVYLQSVQSFPRISVSSQESESDHLYRQHGLSESYNGKSSSVFSQSSSPIKSPEPSVEEEVEEVEEEEEEEMVEVEEVEIVNVIEQKPAVIQKSSRLELRSEVKEVPQVMKMDTRFFGELLAEVYRKNCDIHSCISEHVAKIRGRKHQLDPSNDYKVEKEEVEGLIPKGASELTKQQIRYLLQTRLTADKSMRLLLSTFSSLREELIHMSEDLRRLESEKETLERDLSFKADQAQQYDRLLEAIRENNRQLQVSVKQSSVSQRSLESQLMSSRSTDSSREFKLKELEGRMRAMEKENDMLRQKLAGQCSSSTLQTKTEELSRHYSEQLNAMREEKDRELQSLRSQLVKIQKTTVTTERSSSERSLQLKISELLSLMEQRQTVITRQEEEIRKLLQEKSDSSKNFTKTIITKRYRNQYPILGLLGDDYLASSPIKEGKTIVIERTGEIIKQEIITTP